MVKVETGLFLAFVRKHLQLLASGLDPSVGPVFEVREVGEELSLFLRLSNFKALL